MGHAKPNHLTYKSIKQLDIFNEMVGNFVAVLCDKSRFIKPKALSLPNPQQVLLCA